mgnify:FL=1
MGKDKYDDHLEEQKRLQQEQQGWKALFKHNVVGPITIGLIIGCVGIFTPYEYELGFIGLGMAAIGFYNWFKE